jgi:hypothetical protein
MGLDLYAGTLERYHTGAWETEAQRVGREAGVPVKIAYPNGLSKRLSKLTAAPLIGLWRERIQRKYAPIIKRDLNWSEASSIPYFARKPDHDGQRALVFAAAYTEHPEFEMPSRLPDRAEDDPAYQAVSKNYLQSAVCVLECHMFLPSDDNFVCAEPDVIGNRRFITSTGNLAWALDLVNKAHWQADDARCAEWATRGPLTRRVFHVENGKIVSETKLDAVANPFEHAAQFGFAVYRQALMFSREHNVPIVTDE